MDTDNFLHPIIRRRVRALKRIQYDGLQLEVQFYKELAELERKYTKKFEKLYSQKLLPSKYECSTLHTSAKFNILTTHTTEEDDFFEIIITDLNALLGNSKRHAIVSGTYEPTIEETEFFLSQDDDDDPNMSYKSSKSTNEGDILEESQNGMFILRYCTNSYYFYKNYYNNDSDNVTKNVPVGIPGFWLTVLKHSPLISDLISQSDSAVLYHLIDLRSIPIEENGKSGFQLEFEFETNNFFTNNILYKRYFMDYDVKNDNPFSYNGPEVNYSEGCHIDWRPNKNIMVQNCLKKHQNKPKIENTYSFPQYQVSAEGVTTSTSSSTLSLNDESFFQFFSISNQALSGKASDPAFEHKILEDYDIGQYLKERVIPRAVTYFTGEALESDDDNEDVGADGGYDDIDEDDDFEVREMLNEIHWTNILN
ncbi:unnamed protein product [Trichobilharzia szidati]|nr:unnamed protein product [Trichobilharzia szidati]